MGADVYLRSVHDRAKILWEPKFKANVWNRDRQVHDSEMHAFYQRQVMEAYRGMHDAGYYWDPYNEYSLFAQLGISWWRDVGDLCDPDGRLPLEKVPALRMRIANAPLDTAPAENVAREQGDNPPDDGWTVHYETDRCGLLCLLDQSLELGEPLYMSL
jgi:hypothetical protein